MQLHDNITGSSLSGSPFRRDAFVAEGVTSTVEEISLRAFFLSLSPRERALVSTEVFKRDKRFNFFPALSIFECFSQAKEESLAIF